MTVPADCCVGSPIGREIIRKPYPGYLSLAAFSSPDIVPDDRMPQLCREILSLRRKGDWFIVYSDNITEWDSLRKYYSECLSKAALVSFHGWNSFACASEEAAEIHSAIPENERKEQADGCKARL